MSRNVITASFSLPGELLKDIEGHAKHLKLSRSEVVSNALREHLDELRDEAEYAETVYRATRKEKTYTLGEMKKMFGLK